MSDETTGETTAGPESGPAESVPHPTPAEAIPTEAAPAEAIPAEAAPGPVAPNPRRNLLQRVGPVGRAISGLVATISFITGIIAVVPIFTRDATNFDSLRIEASALAGELEFAVPTDAPFDAFPEGPAGACSAEQQAWLQANGRPIVTRYLVDLRNVASEGPMLALKQFRGTGESGQGAGLIKVVCDPTGAGAGQLQYARLLVSDPTQIAYFDKSAYGQTAEGIPDSPVAWNLAPGETGQIVLALFPTAPFTGSLELTAVSGTEERQFAITVADGEELALPGLVRGGLAYLQVDGGLRCLQIEGAERVECEPSELFAG